jgi:hypothetical protein
MDQRIDNIRQDLSQITQEEYKKHGYDATKTSAKPLKDKAPKNEKEINMEVNNLQYKFNNMIYKNEKKNKNNPGEQKEVNQNVEFMDNTADMFNIVDNDKEYLEWRKLAIEERLEILEEYLESIIDLDEEVKEQLRNMVEKQAILYKKDIDYDKINKKILKINILKKVDGKYILKEDVKKVNVRKKNQSNINKLLKKI